MLPRQSRISKHDLAPALKKSALFASDHLTLRIHQRLAGEVGFGQQTKLAVIIANKILPRSVDRHLVKRRIHAIWEKKLVNILANLDLIIQVKKSPLSLTFLELESELTDLLKTAKVLE